MSEPDRRLAVLCVDGDLIHAAAVALGFRSHGLAVVTARDSAEAWRLYRRQLQKFASVLVDHDLPNGDGLQLIQQLHAAGYRGYILVMSRYWTETNFRAYQDYGINGFLPKPFSISLVARMIEG